MSASKVVNLVVQVPVKPQIDVERFGNLRVGGVQQNATIQQLTLITSYMRPYHAELKVNAVDSKGVTFSTHFQFTYSVGLGDSNNTMTLHLTRQRDSEPEVWYKLDEALVKQVLNA